LSRLINRLVVYREKEVTAKNASVDNCEVPDSA
jgi:hypothetical protein